LSLSISGAAETGDGKLFYGGHPAVLFHLEGETNREFRQIRLCLLESVSYPAPRQIVRRHLHANAVAYQDTYAVLAHFAGNSCQYDMRTIVQLDFEKCVGLFVDYRALRWN
jgi:hypothetical protein